MFTRSLVRHQRAFRNFLLHKRLLHKIIAEVRGDRNV